MATDSIVRKNLLFLTGTTSASFMSLWRLDHPGPCSQRGSTCGLIICRLCCESLTAFWTKYPHFYFAMCPSHYAANCEDFIYCLWIKGTPQTSSNTGRLPWELCDTIMLSWQWAGCSESTPTPSRNISIMSALSENSACVNLQKIHHTNSIENTRTKYKMKLLHFFPSNSTIWLFFLIYLSLWFSIWKQINLGSDPYHKSSECIKGLILLQKGNSLMLTACCKDAELADRKCCLLCTRSMVQRTNVLYLNKQPRWGQPKAFPLCLWHSK